MSPPFDRWLVAFVWTCALELPVYAVVLRGAFARWWQVVALAIGLQAATHPALWYLYPRFEPRGVWILVAESSVTLVEAGLVFAALRARPTAARAASRAGSAALLANATSVLAGLAC